MKTSPAAREQSVGWSSAYSRRRQYETVVICGSTPVYEDSALVKTNPERGKETTDMTWQITSLTVDFNTDQATMVVASLPLPTQNLTLNFSMPEMAKLKPSAAQTLDNVSRQALIAH